MYTHWSLGSGRERVNIDFFALSDSHKCAEYVLYSPGSIPQHVEDKSLDKYAVTMSGNVTPCVADTIFIVFCVWQWYTVSKTSGTGK